MSRDVAATSEVASPEPRPAGPWRDTFGYVVSHGLTEVFEWVAMLALVVHAYDRAGATVAGLAAVTSHVPSVLTAPLVGRWVQASRPARSLVAGLAGQVTGYGLAGAAALAGGPLPLVVAGVMAGLVAVTAIRPSGAVLLPALVRTPADLTAVNVLIGRIEASAGLAGPLVATGFLALGGAPVALAGGAAGMAVALLANVPTLRLDPGPNLSAKTIRPNADDTAWSRIRTRLPTRRAAGERLRRRGAAVRRPETTGVLLAWSTRFLTFGVFDIVLVVVAAEYIDLGRAGAGVLSILVGVGAVASVAAANRLARADALGARIQIALAAIAVAAAGFGLLLDLPSAVVALPVCGFALSVVDILGRVLLQRSAPPAELGRLFGLVETMNRGAVMAGSVVAQIAIAASGPRLALWALSFLALGAALIGWRGLRRIDAVADVPVVDMSLLAQHPVFATLPSPQLEMVARGARRVAVATDETVVRQGDEGREFFAICSGTFEVSLSGRTIRELGRGDGFGEVALLAEVPRTATVTSRSSGELLAIDRDLFLLAVTGHAPAHTMAWHQMASLEHETSAPTPPLELETSGDAAPMVIAAGDHVDPADGTESPGAAQPTPP